MPETSQPPPSTDPTVSTVSTVARLLATVALLHGSELDGTELRGSGLDRDTAIALVDAVAYLASTGDTTGADRLLRLVTADPETLAAVHVALHVPARRPTANSDVDPEPADPTTSARDLPPLPRRVPRRYRDPGSSGRAANPTATDSLARRPAGRAATAAGGTATAGTAAVPLAGTRRWLDASVAQVLSLDYAVVGDGGTPTGVYVPVPIVHPPGWCDHLDTICAHCLRGWSEDHAVAVFRHGRDGATAGCRCPVCRTAIPATTDGPDSTDSPAAPAGGSTSWFGGEGS